ncbi:hypothetical protein GQ53DRAFT_156517 [Thozetella sp. PMI_491]|nr:hypothetical protein GQ53DRAFT_156517 [Thozetella sp. PMI_491]
MGDGGRYIPDCLPALANQGSWPPARALPPLNTKRPAAHTPRAAVLQTLSTNSCYGTAANITLDIAAVPVARGPILFASTYWIFVFCICQFAASHSIVLAAALAAQLLILRICLRPLSIYLQFCCSYLVGLDRAVIPALPFTTRHILQDGLRGAGESRAIAPAPLTVAPSSLLLCCSPPTIAHHSDADPA